MAETYIDNMGFEVQGLREAKTKKEKLRAWETHLNQMKGMYHENEYYIEGKVAELRE